MGVLPAEYARTSALGADRSLNVRDWKRFSKVRF